MEKYEMMAIVANNLSEKEAEAVAQDIVLGKIKEFGGKVTFEDFWGSRGFAYKIKGEKWGYYFVTQFEIEGAKTLDIRKDLNIDTNIVRFLITKVPVNAEAPKKYADIQKENAATEKDKASEAAADKKPVKKEKLTTVASKAEKPEAKAAEPRKDAVDKKLDAIVSDSSLDL